MTIENPADVLERTLKRVREENEQLKKQLDYLRSGKYLNQVKWERDFNEKMVEELQQRIYKAIEWIEDHIDVFEERNITIYDWNSLSNPKDLLEILKGDSNE